MNFLPPTLDAYIEAHSHGPSALLADLERQTHLRCLMPQMCSGYLQGRVLAMISRMIAPKRILEIGTFTGYSALCLAEGLSEGGVLHSVDLNPEVMDMARDYIQRSAYHDQIQLHTGSGLDILENVQESWDLVFVDADKENYPNYLKALTEILKPGAYILADNVLWSGKVAETGSHQDAETEALREYNRLALAHPRLETVILPIRDGLSLARLR
ncbi:MAG: O-methyltransferase [Bacteroidota bacterium]